MTFYKIDIWKGEKRWKMSMQDNRWNVASENSKNMAEELKMCRENKVIIICVILPDNNFRNSKFCSASIYFPFTSQKLSKLEVCYGRVKFFVAFSGGTATFYSSGLLNLNLLRVLSSPNIFCFFKWK